MLILTRKTGESLYIGDNVKITVVEVKGNQIRLGIDAPRDVRIYREEIYEQIMEENRAASDVGSALPEGFKLRGESSSDDGSNKKKGLKSLVVKRGSGKSDE